MEGFKKKDHLNLPVNKFTDEQILGVGVKSHENSGSVMRIQGREREKKKKKKERFLESGGGVKQRWDRLTR